MYYYNDSYYNYDYLQHYGVKGMKWGHRKKYYNSDGTLNARGQTRQDYKQSRKALKQAYKAERKAGRRAFGIKGIQNYKDAHAKTNQTYVDSVSAKAKYNAAKSRNSDKAEFKTYAKAMGKTGIRGSYYDSRSGGKTTALYNDIAIKKGKEYADRVEKRVQNQAVATMVAGAAVTVGSMVAQAYLDKKLR